MHTPPLHYGACGLHKITHYSTYRRNPMRTINRLTYGLIALTIAYVGGHLIIALLHNRL